MQGLRKEADMTDRYPIPEFLRQPKPFVRAPIERPILFSSPMVRALLAGTKTQTRRMVKPVGNDGGFVLLDHGSGWWPYRSDDGESQVVNGCDEIPHACRYGRAGDRLWVREAWASIDKDYKPADLAQATALVYRADGLKVPNQKCREIRATFADRCRVRGAIKWRPSIHMPRIASRLDLEIESVRVKRLQDISEADARAEGVIEGAGDFAGCFSVPGTQAMSGTTAKECYARLWDDINGESAWSMNPFIWVIEFRRLEARNAST